MPGAYFQYVTDYIKHKVNAAEPGKPVSGVLTQSSLNEGQSGAPDAEPSHISKASHEGTHQSALSQGRLTLGASFHRGLTMGEPID